jgi:hypothetical protein
MSAVIDFTLDSTVSGAEGEPPRRLNNHGKKQAPPNKPTNPRKRRALHGLDLEGNSSDKEHVPPEKVRKTCLPCMKRAYKTGRYSYQLGKGKGCTAYGRSHSICD